MEPPAPPPETPDAVLVERAQAGDLKAFDELVLRHQRALYGIIYNLLLNHAETEDVLMTTLTKAFRGLKGFRATAQFYSWIYRIAHNEALNFLRKRSRTPPTVEIAPGQEDDEIGTPELIDTRHEGNAARTLQGKELENKLNEALARLSNKHRAVVTLFDIQGLSHAEIGKIVGCSENTVRSRLHYAHKYLQKLLKPYIR